MPTIVESVPKLYQLPPSLSRENAIGIELDKNVLIFRATEHTQNRIEDLLGKQMKSDLSEVEEGELRQYEEIDDYLSFLNRLTRNLAESENGEVS